mmetsp:Transcript_35569/g.112219  ORF Transcript_35569/g.112219 Transcript_35569/m.112219 type:complete len:155 (+) Transcript_35569:102-566(+)
MIATTACALGPTPRLCLRASSQPKPRHSSSGAGPGRRGALLGGGAAGLLLAAPALAKKASVFTGDYNDPSHPGCLRRIDADGNVFGADPIPIKPGAPCLPGAETSPWQLVGKVSKDDKVIMIDFDPIDEVKQGPAKGVWTGEGLQLPNGLWTKK